MPVSTSKWNVYLKSTPLPQRFSGIPKQLYKTEVKHHRTKSEKPASIKPTEEDSHSFLFGSVPASMDDTLNSDSKLENTLSLGSLKMSKDVPDFLPGGTDFSLRSTVPGTYEKDRRDRSQKSVERSTAILLAKRSLNSKSQKGASQSNNLLQTWVTTTSHPKVDSKIADIGMTPVARERAFQMSKRMVPVTNTHLSSLKTGVRLSEHLTNPVEQPGHLNNPENFQTHTQTLPREPKPFTKTKLSKGKSTRGISL